jgi:hypothetical protein
LTAAAADVLAEPDGRVLFAGEAASTKPATVLGAYLSGQREAKRLLQLLQQEQQDSSTAGTASTRAATVNATGGLL